MEGFSTGKWEGDMLTVETTHLKTGLCPPQRSPAQRKGAVREHFIRNGDVLTWISIVNDPAYLTEPYIKSRNSTTTPAIR